MFFEVHKSISAVLLCYTVFIVLNGGLCQKILPKNTVCKESDQEAPKAHPRLHRNAPNSNDPSSVSGKDAGGGRLFPPLTYNKYQTRMSRFHEGPSRFLGGGGGLGYRTPAVINFGQDAPGFEGQTQESDGGRQQGFETLGEQDPTFTPFISARALSNMPQFFDYLKANLNALSKDEAEIDSDEFDSGHGDDEDFGAGKFYSNNDNNFGGGGGGFMDIPNYPDQKGLNHRWPPASFGNGVVRARGPNIRHFVQGGYNPSRNVYEFGLG